MNSTESRPSYFPTKYDSARDEIIGQTAFESDDSTGDVESPVGYIALVSLLGRIEDLGGDDYAIELATTYGVEPAEWFGHHIVTTTDQGFVYVESFDSESLAREEYDCRAARYAEWADEERDEDSGDVYVCPVQGHGYHTL